MTGDKITKQEKSDRLPSLIQENPVSVQLNSSSVQNHSSHTKWAYRPVKVIQTSENTLLVKWDFIPIEETLDLLDFPDIPRILQPDLVTFLYLLVRELEKLHESGQLDFPFMQNCPYVQKMSLPTTEETSELQNVQVDSPLTILPSKIFYNYKKGNDYLFENALPVSQLQSNTNYSLPVIVDTEYVSPEFENIENADIDSFIEPRRHVTTQFKALNSHRPYVLVHQDLLVANSERITRSDNPYSVVRHPIIRDNQHAHIVPFLRLEGYDAHIRRDAEAHEKKNKRAYRYPFIDLKLYAHMLVVDLTQIFEGSFSDDLKSAFLRRKIVQKRRLSASGWQQSVDMPWILSINGIDFRVKLSLVDTLALHGNASFKEICDNTGVLLTVKAEMDDWKPAMDRAYFEVPDLFDQYATEDLKGDEVLKNYARNIQKIYQDLGVADWYTPPKLTIGSTVNKLFEAKISEFIGLTPDIPKKQRTEFLKKFTHQGSADYLKTLVQSNAYLLGKCDGGRCRNAYPTRSSFKGLLVDIDISSAYTTAMSSLSYPLGNPVILSFKKVLLKDFFKPHRRNLIDRLWTMRIRTREDLAYEQSLIPSWFHDGKTINRGRIHKNDGESYAITGEVDLDSGETKTFSQEIVQGTLTSDLLDIIENVWSPRQREDFFNKIEILAIAFYPKSLQVSSVLEVSDALDSFQGNPDFATTLAGAEVINSQDCHVWTTFPIGEQFVDLFKIYRNRHPKGSPLNILYKLFANTTYGDAVSKYFETSNMIFGSNITARCRAMMYLMEIGLNLQGSITDGHVFDVNRILHKKEGKYLNSDHFVRLYTKKAKEIKGGDMGHLRSLFEKPVTKQEGGFLINDEFCTYEEAREKVNRQAEQHLIKLFSKVGIIGKTFQKLKDKSVTLDYVEEQSLFRLEMKDFVAVASFQGAANYQFVFFDDDPDLEKVTKLKTKMRSYESKKKCCAFAFESGNTFPTLQQKFYTKDETPDVHLLREIRKNPEGVHFLPPFTKPYIIKTGDYRNRYGSLWKDSWLMPGDSSVKVQTIRYFSVSQFTYKNLKQYLNWKKAEVKLVAEFGYSFELFFIRNHLLDYDEMIAVIDLKIREGVMNPLATCFKRHNFNRVEIAVALKNYENLEKMRVHLTKKMKSDVYESFQSDDEDYDG